MISSLFCLIYQEKLLNIYLPHFHTSEHNVFRIFVRKLSDYLKLMKHTFQLFEITILHLLNTTI